MGWEVVKNHYAIGTRAPGAARDGRERGAARQFGHLGEAGALKVVEVLVLKGLADLHDAVSAEVEDDDCIVVLHGPHCGAGVVGDDERREPLVGDGVLLGSLLIRSGARHRRLAKQQQGRHPS